MVLEAWGRDVYSAGDGCYLGMQGLWSPDWCSHSGLDSEVEAIERHFVKGLELFRSEDGEQGRYMALSAQSMG